MRKIITSDVFKLARIIKKANAKEELKNIFAQIQETDDNIEQTQEKIGMEVVAFLIESCGDEAVEKAVYDLLAGIAEKKVEEIQNQSIDETIEMLKKISEENNLSYFFSVAVKSA